MRKNLTDPDRIAAGDGSGQTAVASGRGKLRPLGRILLAVVTPLIGTSLFVAPANATTWYSDNGRCGTFWADTCAAEWTGGAPGGVIRAIGDRNEYEIALYATCGAGWILKARSFPAGGGSITTPAVSVSNHCGYQAWAKFSSGGKWWYSNVGITWFG
jgi:hypothetical protein